MMSRDELKNDLLSSIAKDGWQLVQEDCALPFPLTDGYEDESAAAVVVEKAGQKIVIVVKGVAPESAYPDIIRAVIERHAKYQPSVGDIDTEIIIDQSKGHYALGHNGWANGYRIHGAVIHIDIRGGKIWIQHDGTEDGVALELIAAGVPKDKIVLAFKSPEMRKLTEFAVA